MTLGTATPDGSGTVLLMVKDRDLAGLLSLTLGRSGFQCLEACDTVTGLDMIGPRSPDVMVVDSDLTQCREDCDSLRRMRAATQIPMLVLSAHGQREGSNPEPG